MRIVVGIDGLRLQTRDCVKFLRLWFGWLQIIIGVVLRITVIMAVIVFIVINSNRISSHNYTSNTIWVLPPLINSWIIFLLQLYKALNMTPIIDC